MIGRQVGGRDSGITWFTFAALSDAILEESLGFVRPGRLQGEEQEEWEGANRRTRPLGEWDTHTALRLRLPGLWGLRAGAGLGGGTELGVSPLGWKFVPVFWKEVRSSGAARSPPLQPEQQLQRRAAPPVWLPACPQTGCVYRGLWRRADPGSQLLENRFPLYFHPEPSSGQPERCSPAGGASEAGKCSSESRVLPGAPLPPPDSKFSAWFCPGSGPVRFWGVSWTGQEVCSVWNLVSSWRDFYWIFIGFYGKNNWKPVLCGKCVCGSELRTEPSRVRTCPLERKVSRFHFFRLTDWKLTAKRIWSWCHNRSWYKGLFRRF